MQTREAALIAALIEEAIDLLLAAGRALKARTGPDVKTIAVTQKQLEIRRKKTARALHCRTVFIKHFLQGESYLAISKEIGRSTTSARTAVLTGRDHYRQRREVPAFHHPDQLRSGLSDLQLRGSTWLARSNEDYFDPNGIWGRSAKKLCWACEKKKPHYTLFEKLNTPDRFAVFIFDANAEG